MKLPALVLGLMAGWSVASAQVTTATIYGTVRDRSEAAIPAAQVQIDNEETGSQVTAASGNTGDFTVTFLPIGRYTIRVTATGFRPLVRSGIVLSAGQSVRLPFVLEVGEVKEAVNVTAEVPLLNTVSAEQRANVETTQVRELPVANRDWTNLLRLTPGMNLVSGSVSLNGLPSAGFTFTVDGTDASGDSELPSVSLYENWNVIKGVSTEAISEVNIAKGVASAEIASSMSGNVNIITKGGTNQFHGSLFHNNQTENLNARYQFLATRPPLTFNQFGGSIGGPIVRNKLFFFGTYEGLRQSAFRAVTATLPTPEFKAQAIAAVPAYKAYLDLLPNPNSSYAPGATTAQYIGAGSNAAHDNHGVVRVDYHVNSTNLLSMRYTRSRPFQLIPRATPANGRTYDGVVEVGTFNYTHSAASWSSETRFGYNQNDITRLDNLLNVGGKPVPAIICCLGFSENGNAKVFYKAGSSKTLEEVLAKNIGRHSIKTGALYAYRPARRDGPGNADFQYSSVADFLANIPSTITYTFGTQAFQERTWQLGGFVQDDFKIRPNLMINLGMRYDYLSVPKEEKARLFNRSGPFGSGPLRSPDSIYNADRLNFAPRLGFAWMIDKSQKTVLRGGAGVFVSPHTIFGGPIEVYRDSLSQPSRSTFSRAEAISLGLGYPKGLEDVRSLVQNPNAPWSNTSIETNFPNPYSMQWTLSLQRQVTQTLAVEAGYIGTRGVKLNMVRDINQVDRITGQRPIAGFLQYRYYDTSESSHYHAMQLSLRKRFSSNLSFNVNYTYANNLSYSDNDILLNNPRPQDNNDLRSERAPVPYDVRQRWVSDFLYELPLMKLTHSSSAATRAVLGGWQVAGILTCETGTPLTIEQPTSLPGSRPDYVGGTAILGNYRGTLQYIDRSTFARLPLIAASGGTTRPGNAARGIIRAPGAWTPDLALSKNFTFHEHYRFQFRADMFNGFNHTNLSGVVTNITSGTFGRITSTRGARVVQLNARLTF